MLNLSTNVKKCLSYRSKAFSASKEIKSVIILCVYTWLMILNNLLMLSVMNPDWSCFTMEGVNIDVFWLEV